jgi:hypothetical protein
MEKSHRDPFSFRARVDLLRHAGIVKKPVRPPLSQELQDALHKKQTAGYAVDNARARVKEAEAALRAAVEDEYLASTEYNRIRAKERA